MPGDGGMDQTRINHFIRSLQVKFPGLWESLNDAQRKHIRALAAKSEGPKAFYKAVRATKGYTTWHDSQETPPEEPPVDDEDPPPTDGGGDDDETPDPETPTEEGPEIDQNVLELMTSFLNENQLPTSLLGFIQEALAQKKPYSQIIAELRQTPEYKAAYPENEIRMANGLDWIPESQIRGLRSEIIRLSSEYLGVGNVTQEELNNVIGKGWSLATWERKLQRYKEFERWGPTVRAVLESEVGGVIDDERLFAFFDDTPTPELDHAYETALMRAQPAMLGLGVRPEEEAELLRRYGIAPEQAFAGYQNIARELPRSERMGLIEAEINRNVDKFPTGTELFADTPFATLFRAVQLQDQDAISVLQGQLAREVARFQGQGGVAQDQQGASVGLLDPDEQ